MSDTQALVTSVTLAVRPLGARHPLPRCCTMMDSVTATRTFHDLFTFLTIRVLPFYIITRILIYNFGMQTTTEGMSVTNRIREAKDFAELCRIFGYVHEEHVVTTEDGYMLTLHRILPKAVEGSAKDVTRPAVYLQHGLLTSSELFVCVTDANRCLPFVLTEDGYDVWLGNNRWAITSRCL